MDNYKLVETFSEFKEFKNIDREAMMRIIEDVFRGMLNKKFDTDTTDFIDIIVNVDKGDFEIYHNRTVVEDGKCVGYPMTISPFINYKLNSAGVPAKGADRFIAVGHYDYLAMQIHGQAMFNVDAQSAEVFSRRTVVVSLALDMSMTELSSKVNGKSGKPQAFKLIKLVPAASNSDI